MTQPTTNSDSNDQAPAGSPVSVNGHSTKTNGQNRKATGRKAELLDTTALIEQAEKLRTAFHDLMHDASTLVKALKQHRRQTRAIQTTLASLRQLKAIRV